MQSARIGLIAWVFAGCDVDGERTDDHGHPELEPFRLRFSATHDGNPVDCTSPMAGLGPDGQHTVGTSDVRFYVSELRLLDASGAEVETTLDDDEFQHGGDAGWVGLVDLTSNSAGDCRSTATSFSEGTERTNDAITGRTRPADVTAISFSVGVPQALMKAVVAEHTAEAAPSPLAEMYWSWATGYRHFVFNSTVGDGAEQGEGYLHLGSMGCAAEGELALEGRETCELVNTPRVRLDGFDLAADTVTVDLGVALQGLDLIVPVYDPETFEVMGEQPGVSCHSSPSQPHCPIVFDNFGLDLESGAADAARNRVFGRG
jgi:uncharacterized repeat protein (TIGR04052 family)